MKGKRVKKVEVRSGDNLNKQCYQVHTCIEDLLPKLHNKISDDHMIILKAASHIIGMLGIFGLNEPL